MMFCMLLVKHKSETVRVDVQEKINLKYTQYNWLFHRCMVSDIYNEAAYEYCPQ